MPIASYKADRRLVLRPYEETDRRNAVEEKPAEIREAARRTAPAHVRIDPDLLELDCLGRPGRRFRLEENHAAVLDPQPRPFVLDLAPRTPAKPSGSRSIGSTPISCSWAAAHAGIRTSSRSPQPRGAQPVSADTGGSRSTYTGWPGRSSRGAGMRASPSSDTAVSSPMSMRGPERATSCANAPQSCPDGTR